MNSDEKARLCPPPDPDPRNQDGHLATAAHQEALVRRTVPAKRTARKAPRAGTADSGGITAEKCYPKSRPRSGTRAPPPIRESGEEYAQRRRKTALLDVRYGREKVRVASASIFCSAECGSEPRVGGEVSRRRPGVGRSRAAPRRCPEKLFPRRRSHQCLARGVHVEDLRDCEIQIIRLRDPACSVASCISSSSW